MKTNQLISDITEKLKRELNNHGRNPMCYRSFEAYRCAGGIETLLIEEGFLNPADTFQYLEGGKKYFPIIGDFRWTEAYPHFILRKSEEYLSQFLPAQEEALLIQLAYRNGWVLTGHKGEECYWRHPATNTDKLIDWDKPLKEQLPFEVTTK